MKNQKCFPARGMSAATWHNRASRTVHTQIHPLHPPTFTKRFLLNPSMTRNGEQWLTCVLERLWMVWWMWPPRATVQHTLGDAAIQPHVCWHWRCTSNKSRWSSHWYLWFALFKVIWSMWWMAPTFSVVRQIAIEQIPDCCNSRWLEFTDFVWHCSYRKILRMGCKLQYTRIFKLFFTS